MTQDELKKYNFNFNKNFGQNFIFDQNLLSAIVKDAQVDGCNVLEIGPGAGGLTSHLCEVANKVVAYEIDTNLQDILHDNLAKYNNVQVIFQDIMKADIKDIESHFDGNYTVVANLPYYITTPIIFKFMEQATKLDKLVIMVQYEVAERLVAKHNTENYGAITVALGTVADVAITRKVGRKNFVPMPNVDSAIVTITLNKSKYNIKDIEVLRKLIRSAFAMRRKILANNLKKDFKLNTEQISKVFGMCGIQPNIRGEALDCAQFVQLSNAIACI